MIKCFIFDVGGVLIKFSNKMYYGYLRQVSGRSYEDIKSLMDPLMARFELGESTFSNFQNRACKELGIKKSGFRFMQFYRQNLVINHDVIKIAKDIHKKYTTALLTNIDRPRYTYSTRLISPETFDYKFASCYLGMRKPEPEIYEFVLKRIGVKSSEAVFIDNQKENLYSARMMGIHSILFVGNKDLRIKINKILKQ